MSGTVTSGREQRIARLPGMAAAGMSQSDAADHFGVRRQRISQDCEEIGMTWSEMRSKSAKKSAKAKPKPAEAPKDPQQRRLEAMPRDGRWSVEQDVEILKTKGRYEALSALAKAWGRSHQSILSRWHVVRAA